MSNFWIVNRKNFFTPALTLFVVLSSVFLYSIELKDRSQLFQLSFVFSILIFMISVFILNYHQIFQNFVQKKNLYVILNSLLFSMIVYFVIGSVNDLTDQIYPVSFLSNYAIANLIVLIQLGVNQKISQLKINLLLFYFILGVFALYWYKPDFLVSIDNLSIRLLQVTGFVLICVEIFRLVRVSGLIQKIFEGEK